MPRAGGAVSRGRTPAVAAQRRHDRHATAAAVLTWLSVLVGVAPHWLVGTSFIECDSGRHSLKYLVSHDFRWALALAATLAGPVWFWWWQRSAMGFGAAIGAVISAAAAVSVTLCVATADLIDAPAQAGRGGTYPLLILAGVLSAAAFVIAPPPADREALNDLQVRGLVRRSRSERPAACPRHADDPTRDVRGPGAPFAIRAARRRLEQNAERAGAMCLLFAAAVCVVAPLATPGQAVIVRHMGFASRDIDLLSLPLTDLGWASCCAALAAAPFLLFGWHRYALSFGRTVGVAMSLSGSVAMYVKLALCDLDPTWSVRSDAWLLPLFGVAFTLMFLVAPTPVARDGLDPLRFRRALRRHRAQFAKR